MNGLLFNGYSTGNFASKECLIPCNHNKNNIPTNLAFAFVPMTGFLAMVLFFILNVLKIRSIGLIS